MATSKGRGANNSKSASKKSAPAKKSAASGSSARGGAAQKKSAAPKKAASKSTVSKSVASKSTAQKSAAGRRGGAATATKKSATSRNGSSNSSAAGRGTQTRGAASKAATGTRSAASKGRGKAAAADPRNDLAKILQDLMQDIYYAEKKLTKALGKMAKNATDGRLKEAFTTHQAQTEEQVTRLEEAFEILGQKAKAKKCAAMDGLLEEANEHIEEYEKGAGLDAALIVGAQKVEHYEIAAYGSMRSFARTLGYDEAATIFEEIREQESDTDELLTTIAEGVVNLKAEDEAEDVKGGGNGGGSSSRGSGGSQDSDAGEDSSSAVSGRSNTGGGADSNDNGSSDNDGGGRGISALTDGNDRGETGEAMGY